MFFEVLTDLIH